MYNNGEFSLVSMTHGFIPRLTILKKGKYIKKKRKVILYNTKGRRYNTLYIKKELLVDFRYLGVIIDRYYKQID